MSTEEIIDAVLSAPKIEWGFVQHIHSLERSKSHRVPSGGGTWVFNQKRTGGFRVCIGTPEELADIENEDLMTAVREAFAKLKLPLPETISSVQLPQTKERFALKGGRV